MLFQALVLNLGLVSIGLALEHEVLSDSLLIGRYKQAQLEVTTSCPVHPNLFISRWLLENNRMCPLQSNKLSSKKDKYAANYENSLQNPSHCTNGLQSNEQYCIYTFPKFANGRGVSILTTPSTAEDIATAFHQDGPLLYPPTQSPLFYEMEIPGRGKGLISNSTFFKGDLILTSTPLFIVNEKAMAVLPMEKRLTLQRQAIESLPLASSKLFYALAGHFGVEKTEDVILTNGFNAGFGKSKEGHGIVVPEAARLNHDCRPNARFAFDPKTLIHKVHATTTIYAGEELTFSYIDEKQIFERRQAQIESHWGFRCSCKLCSSSESSRAASDARLERLAVLRTSLLVFAGESMIDTTPDMGLELIALYEQEKLTGLLAEAYMLAALRYCIWELEVESKRWAKVAVKHWLVWEAAGKENLNNVKILSVDPKKVWCWGLNRIN